MGGGSFALDACTTVSTPTVNAPFPPPMAGLIVIMDFPITGLGADTFGIEFVSAGFSTRTGCAVPVEKRPTNCGCGGACCCGSTTPVALVATTPVALFTVVVAAPPTTELALASPSASCLPLPRGTGREIYPSRDGENPSFAAVLFPVEIGGLFPSQTNVQSLWVPLLLLLVAVVFSRARLRSTTGFSLLIVVFSMAILLLVVVLLSFCCPGGF